MCIIDDREDVWDNSPNLIQVKPYHFFAVTADINDILSRINRIKDNSYLAPGNFEFTHSIFIFIYREPFSGFFKLEDNSFYKFPKWFGTV